VSPRELSVEDLSAGYGTLRRPNNVLHSVDFSLTAGQTLGVVGESGSGKSTLARVIVGQIDPSHGLIRLGGQDIKSLPRRERRKARRRIQLIPQDPYASLDPRMVIGEALAEALAPTGRRPRDATARIAQLLTGVGLDPEVVGRYPHEFSGGQRQRIAIARALATTPDVIVADEVTSALDASVQAEVLNLLRALQQSTQISMIFITHDLSVAHYMCDTVAVLYQGRIVERGTSDLFFDPTHPYTELLLASIPRIRDGESDGSVSRRMNQDAPDPSSPRTGCAFYPRCHRGPLIDETRTVCVSHRPETTIVAVQQEGMNVREVACHFPIDARAAERTS
jgi:oligopeptide/dipeptide ABC transporter ATP-binding protein